MATRTKKVKIYEAYWIRNGFCYRTTTNITYDEVLECKKIAKMLGEKIEYEFIGVKIYNLI